ncbi:MAG: hypothetical protein MR964_00020 [Campylobacter sp.]|uniref:hypothetical protein n=1 Tax=Campylobacter sp. TaxID=205 RepID=UPI002AA68A9B|nr:hypothetical protein [Campylobacter sp.]MCI7022610.1 hypothetical protein [Campylobacter sp.]
MKNFLFSAVISAILTSGAFGADLLASITNGKISDNSPSVKVLSLEAATNSLSAPFRQLPGYSITRNIGFNKSGAYTYFTYKVITYDTNLRTYHNITSSQLLNNNAIINELARKYKSTFESILGGLKVGLK